MVPQDFETTIDRDVLLARLRSARAALDHERAKRAPMEALELEEHVRAVADVLAQASKEIRSGKLKPEGSRWCSVRGEIEKRIPEFPDTSYDLNAKIRRLDAAIYQVLNAKRNPMRVTTSQIETWLGGNEVRKSRR